MSTFHKKARQHHFRRRTDEGAGTPDPGRRVSPAPWSCVRWVSSQPSWVPETTIPTCRIASEWEGGHQGESQA